MYLFSRDFWEYSFERLAKTFAQVLGAAIIVSSFSANDLSSWVTALSTAGVASLVSLLTSITSYSSALGTQATPTNIMPKKTSVPLFTITGK
jgi:hypothetical protein